tara:strand:- start:8948 stop:9841 length:894 start_codon:yes stop_codon:yes gene_type:complete
MKKRLGIFLCVWNGEKTIENSINSILRQKYKGLVNLYILDNQSEDTTIKILRRIKKRNKKKNFLIKILIDKKKRDILEAQRYLIKKFLLKTDYCMIMTDDDFYNKNFLDSVILKLEAKNLDLIYTFYNFIDGKNKIFFAKNYPYYTYTKSKLKNLSNFILFRNINPIFFGVYKSSALKTEFKHYRYFDDSKSNHDNVFIFNFLLKKKVGVLKKRYFNFAIKDRNEIEKSRNTGPNYWKISSLFKIFIYQFNFSLKLIKSIMNLYTLSPIEKLLLVFLIVIIYFQKTLFYFIKRVLFN